MKSVVTTLMLLSIAACTHAETYKCTGSDEKIMYQDKPCMDSERQESVNKEKQHPEINEENFIKAFEGFLFDKFVVEGKQLKNQTKNINEFRKAAHNAALCHNSKVNRLSELTQKIWRTGFIKGKNMDKAFEYMKPEMSKLTNQVDGMTVALDLKKITQKTGLCLDELQEDIIAIHMKGVLEKTLDPKTKYN